jgi:poly-gamma-glutamate synthase PgsB/CapB
MLDAVLLPAPWPWLDAITPAARFLVVLIVCVLACIFLWYLAWTHSRRLAEIPVRIHIAGTRGKTTTVRLIAAGLRAGGYRVVAKVTGTQPRIILPDGTERSLRRWGAPAIREQRAFIAAAHRADADAVVVEVMAIEPEYLHALECFYIRATDLVITNVRPDHQEQLGCAPDAMAKAVSETVPFGGRMFLTTEAAVPALLARAASRNCEISVVTCDPDADPEDANRRLAHDVCRRYGVVLEDGDNVMRLASRDIGSFAIAALRPDGRTISFAKAFSCNDVESLERLWRSHQVAGRPAAFLLNPRADRPVRTTELLKLLVRLAPDARLFVVGGNRSLQRQAISAGFLPEHVHRLPLGSAEDILRSVAAAIENDTVVWGIGNFRGAGAGLSALVEAARAPC